jgi:sigma-B regulation protein RsbQ
MLFCHGFGMDQTLWRHLAPHFSERYRIMLMDHVGSGASDLGAYRLGRYATIEGYIQDLLGLLASFELRDVVYVGHSVSAMIGLEASLREPGRFSCLIMLGASPRYLDDAGYRGGLTGKDVEDLLAGFDANREAWAEQMARLAAENPERPEIAKEVERKFLSAEPSILRQFARATFAVDARAKLGACRLPVLLLQSREDPLAPVPVSEYLKAGIPGSRLHYLGTSGHFAQLSAPEEVARAMHAFLADLERNGV